MKNIPLYATQFEDETQQQLATLVHDVKNPLAGIQMSAQLILRNQSNPAVLQRLAEGILGSAAKISLMMDSLLVESEARPTLAPTPFLAPRA